MKLIREKNKMIAEFMGKHWHRDFFKDVCIISPSNISYKFHTSWDWLMPVVEGIEEYEMNVKIHTSYTSIHFKRKQCIVDVDGGSKIENTYNAVVQFIEWYNKQK